MYQAENLVEKWDSILNMDGMPEINNAERKYATLLVMENQLREMGSDKAVLMEAAPINNSMATGGIDRYEPIMLGMVRRSLPNLMPFDVCGVQPMRGPSDIIFCLRSLYGSERANAMTRREALFNEADTSFSSSKFDQSFAQTPLNGAHAGSNPVDGAYTTGHGMTTAEGEALGDALNNQWGQMSFSIDKMSVEAKTRALKAEYTLELAQDLKTVHGLEADDLLATILSQEITFEINREIVRTIYNIAKWGSPATANPGSFNLDVDANGRWSVERFKGLAFNIQRDANHIAQETRRGRGNVLICSSDVASALTLTGVLDPTPALSVDDTGSTYAGNIGKIKVYIDPYSANIGANSQFYVVGYKGQSSWDAGLYYCPYTMMQLVRAINPDTLQPKMGYKTRYGLSQNPFVVGANGKADGDNLTTNQNFYYRKTRVLNLM